MIPRLVPEISPCDGFCDEQEHEELGILGVGFIFAIGGILNTSLLQLVSDILDRNLAELQVKFQEVCDFEFVQPNSAGFEFFQS